MLNAEVVGLAVMHPLQEGMLIERISKIETDEGHDSRTSTVFIIPCRAQRLLFRGGDRPKEWGVVFPFHCFDSGRYISMQASACHLHLVACVRRS